MIAEPEADRGRLKYRRWYVTCAFAQDICRHIVPALKEKTADDFATCHFAPNEMVAA